VAEATERVAKAADSVRSKAQERANGGSLGKVIVPGAVAVTSAAAVYAAMKGAAKLKESVGSKDADAAEDVASDAPGEDAANGGVAGFATKVLDEGRSMLGSAASKVKAGGAKLRDEAGRALPDPAGSGKDSDEQDSLDLDELQARREERQRRRVERREEIGSRS
jgi:hypothetical protein